jgi:hypothetical protein
LKVEGQRSRGQRLESELELELESEWKRSIITKVPGFMKRSTESNWVVDLIFELKIIHVREVAYKQWETNWRINWGNKRDGVTIRLGSCEGSQGTTGNIIQQDDTE